MGLTTLCIPPFTVRLYSPFEEVAGHLARFYAVYERATASAFADFNIRIEHGQGYRRWFGRQACFRLDALEPFLPLPAKQAAPLFEWGLNWAIASRPLGYLVMHAAVLARDDQAIVLPGVPGAGKSTLCASLAFLKGWRLFTDELAILDPQTNLIQPNPRPICVKNESIDVVKAFPSVALGPIYHDTRKGSVSHIAVSAAAVKAAEQAATCRWMVFPRFSAGAPPALEEISRTEAFTMISAQSFNKERMGHIGFEALCNMLANARCFQIEYGSTQDGLDLIDQICTS